MKSNIKLLFLLIILINNCGVGIPDDESSCDNSRVLAIALLGDSELNRIASAYWVVVGCSSSNKQPGP